MTGAPPASPAPACPPAFARELAARLVRICDPRAVLLFGSWAKGTATAHSDVDVIVLLDRHPSPARRAELADALHCLPMKVDMLLWTPADLHAAQADPHGFAGSALCGAVALHVRDPCGSRAWAAEVLPTRLLRV